MKKIIIEEYTKILEKILTILNETLPNCNNVTKCYKNRNKINPKKHLNYFYKRICKVQDKIFNKDLQLFDKPLLLVPEIDISNIWKKIEEPSVHDKLWIYLQSLLLYTRKAKKLENLDDPHYELSKKTLEDIKKYIENTKKESQNNLEQNMNGLFNNDTQGGNIMMNMMSEITTELEKNKDSLPDETKMMQALMTGKMDQLGPIFNIANNIALKMKDKVESNEINKEELMKTTSNMMQQIQSDTNTNIPMNGIMTEIQKINEQNEQKQKKKC